MVSGFKSAYYKATAGMPDYEAERRRFYWHAMARQEDFWTLVYLVLSTFYFWVGLSTIDWLTPVAILGGIVGAWSASCSTNEAQMFRQRAREA